MFEIKGLDSTLIYFKTYLTVNRVNGLLIIYIKYAKIYHFLLRENVFECNENTVVEQCIEEA